MPGGLNEAEFSWVPGFRPTRTPRGRERVLPPHSESQMELVQHEADGVIIT